MNALRKEAKLLHVPRYSKLNKDKLIEAIRKAKYKDVSTQTDGPYCKPCVEIAYEKNLEKSLQNLAKKSRRIVDVEGIQIDVDTGEVIGCEIDYTRM